jgi:predicted aldo/keto reductase-like oxidoreductase
MNEVGQVADNLRTFGSYRPLSEEERKTLFEIAEGMKKGVPCTGCRYCCKGCPMELDIPYLIECYNDYKASASNSMTSGMRIDALAEEKRPAACVACGQCSHACPQGIDVPAVMAELADIYAKAPKWAETAKNRSVIIKKDLNMI